VHAYVINLARSPERREYITAELDKAKVDYEIVTGVEGRDLDLNDKSTIDPVLFNRSSYPEGMVGCALSHLRVYRKILADGLGKAIVLEDDVAVPTDLSSLADAVGGHLTGAEVALLNYDSKETCFMSREGSAGLPASRQLVLPIDVTRPGSSAGYVVTREACERMDKSMLPVRASPDDWWFFYREGILDRVRCVVPLPVRKSPRFESTIGFYSLGTGFKTRLVGPLLHYQVPLVRQMISYRRERIYRRMTHSEFVDMPFTEKPSRLD
jgi:glycosyl transferase family 25